MRGLVPRQGMATAALGELPGVGTDHLHSSTPLLTSQVPSSTPYSNKGRLAAMAARRNGWGMAHNGLEYMSLSFAGLGGYICNGSRASGPAVEHAASGEIISTGFPRNVWNGAFRRPRGDRMRRFPRWPQRQSFGSRVEHARGAAGRIF